MNAIVVMIFGFFGGVLRFQVGEVFPKIGEFPIATLFVNFVGCFFLAFLVEKYLVSKSASERLLLGIGTGFIGSFTTFSSCTLELSLLFLNKHVWLAILYFFLSLLGGLFFVFLGMRLGERVVFKQEERK